MKYRINIAKVFVVLGEALRARAIIPGVSCEASVHNGIVQVAYPHGPFALPCDKFYQLCKDGNITVERSLSEQPQQP